MDNSLLVGILTSAGTAIGWLAGRRKNNSEIEKNEEETREKRITNLSNTIDIYEKVHAELKEQLDLVSRKCSELSNEMAELRKENAALKKEIHQLTEKLKARK